MKFVDSMGIAAQSTQQVIGQSLMNLGFGIAIVTAVIVVVTFGVKALVDNAKRRQDNYMMTPAE